jgi:hypothetical protein
VVIAFLIIGGVVDRRHGPRPSSGGPVVRPMPAAAPASALSSSWFCAGATGQPAQVADGQITVANTTARKLSGTVTLIPSQGNAIPLPLTVEPSGRTVVAETAAGPAPFVGAVVDLEGGGASVEQQVSGAQGLSTSACASTGSDHWYFADGTTQPHANLYLSLLNPYTEDAIVDLSFSTELGPEQPADFQGIVVPARGIVGVDLGSHLRGRAQVATTVGTRAGRVVAFKTQVSNPGPAPVADQATPATGPPARPPGLSLVLGSPALGTTWWWPEGLAAGGVTERYQIYNPGRTEADVSLALTLDQGSADPFVLKVAPRSTTAVVSNHEARVPEGVAHAAVLRSTNGVGVVAERTVDAVAPSPRTGLADVLGSPLTARRWLLAGGTADQNTDAYVIIFNPGLTSARVSVLGLAGGATGDAGPGNLTVPPGRRLLMKLNDTNPNLDKALLIQSSAPVVVERDLDQTKHIGIDATMAVPLDL